MNTMKHQKSGQNVANDVFKPVFVNENVCILSRELVYSGFPLTYAVDENIHVRF